MPTADVLNIQVRLTGVQQAVREMQRLQQKMDSVRGGGGRGGGGRAGAGGGRYGGGGHGGRGFWVGDAFQATGILIRGAERVGQLMVAGAKAAVHSYESFAAFKMGATTLLGEKAAATFVKKFQEFAIPAIYNTESLRAAGLQMAGSLGGDRAIQTLKSVSDILAATGVMDREKADSVFLALQQTAGKGRLTGEEFTRQLSNAAPAFAQLLIKEAGGLDKLIPGGGKPGMSADKLFAMINKIAAEGGFDKSQERLASKSPSLRWGQIMDLMEAKLIPVGEQFAQGLMDGLNALEKGVGGINWESLAATAKKWGEEVGKFIKFLVGKLPQVQKWIENLDLVGIAETGRKVVNAIGWLIDRISGNEGLIAMFLAITWAARGVAAILGSLKLIIGETVGWIAKLLRLKVPGLPGLGGGGGAGASGVIPTGGGGGGAKPAVGGGGKPGSIYGPGSGGSNQWTPPKMGPGGQMEPGYWGPGSAIAGGGASMARVMAVAGRFVSVIGVAITAFDLSTRALNAAAQAAGSKNYSDALRKDFARANGATIDANGDEDYEADPRMKAILAKKEQAKSDQEWEKEKRRRDEEWQRTRKHLEESKRNRPIRNDDIKRIMGRSQYNTLRQV